MQENKNFSNNNSIKNVFIVANPTPKSKPKHSYFCIRKTWQTNKCNYNHLFIAKISKALPKVIQMTMHCSRSPLWRNTAGLCEVQSRIYVVNCWKYYPDYFPDPLALSELVSREGTRLLASFKHTPHQKHGLSQSVTNAGESQWAFDYSAVNLSFEAATFEFVTDASVRALLFTVTGLAAQDGDEDRRIKAWIWVCSSQSYGFWRSGLQRTNKMVSFRNYVVYWYFL